jgi:hypothetical protein
MPTGWIVPNWPAPTRVRALMTTRSGGLSSGPWGAPGPGGMNLGLGSGDDPATVAANRARLRAWLPAEPRWLRQVHGANIVDAESVDAAAQADASTAVTPDVVCAVLVADCMPVLLADRRGRAVAAVHAGWRGLAAGVIQNTVQALRNRLAQASADPGEFVAYLGPAIGPARFEVGADVLSAMRARLPEADAAFRPASQSGKFYADLFALGRQALAQAGVSAVFGGGECTASDSGRFYSYRRDGVTGRHAAVIWIESQRI